VINDKKLRGCREVIDIVIDSRDCVKKKANWNLLWHSFSPLVASDTFSSFSHLSKISWKTSNNLFFANIFFFFCQRYKHKWTAWMEIKISFLLRKKVFFSSRCRRQTFLFKFFFQFSYEDWQLRGRTWETAREIWVKV
jgi:hypothetical protein